MWPSRFVAGVWLRARPAPIVTGHSFKLDARNQAQPSWFLGFSVLGGKLAELPSAWLGASACWAYSKLNAVLLRFLPSGGMEGLAQLAWLTTHDLDASTAPIFMLHSHIAYYLLRVMHILLDHSPATATAWCDTLQTVPSV